MNESEIEVAARAIRDEFMGRVCREGMIPTPWEKLKEYQREAYREEAEAALISVKEFRNNLT